MSLEEVGAHPVVMAKALYGQINKLGFKDGKVPIYSMALSLDIEEIQIVPGLSFEGMILMPKNKARGSVLVKEANKARMRFTLAHELFHFLSLLHKPIGGTGFTCDKVAMRLSSHTSALNTRYQRQEAEANQFAAEILMPRQRIQRLLSKEPSLEHVLHISEEFEVSKEAAAVHYAALHDEPLAIIFSQNNRVRYAIKSGECPWLRYGKKGQGLPAGTITGVLGLGAIEEDDSLDWTTASASEKGDEVRLQTLGQSKGHAMTLIWFY